MAYQWHEFRSREEMYAALAAEVEAGLGRLLAQVPAAGLVATGGTTAPPIFERLSGAALDWHRLTVTLSDERWVAPVHEASNEKMVREKLLSGAAGAARFIPLYEAGNDTPEAAEHACHQRLCAMPWESALCMLGMGRDGHVASLFPLAAALNDALDPRFDRLCKAVRPLSAEIAGPHPRMSLTFAALARVRHIHLLITGDDKRAAFNRACGAGAENEMPVRAILRQSGTPVSVYWAP
ncbi:MAG: 6-phosphogluconolactonase [Gammaproteobacteria bacterium]|nr:6-phosphogluconolactonase [Gammaproteobacteria bacterium]